MKPSTRWLTLIFFLALALMLTLNACSPASPTPAETPSPSPTPTVTPTLQPTTAAQQPYTPAAQQTSTPEVNTTATSSKTHTQTPDLRLRYEMWQSWPILPELSPEMVEVYLLGRKAGRDAHAFSVIGDCQSSPTYFLNLYDEGRYTLSENNQGLQETIDWYAGSFSHRSISVANGLTAPGALNPRWADPDQCNKNESPIHCEIRLHNPSVVLISLGTNWHPSLSHQQYLDYLYQIIEILLENGIVPVLSTKADNVEGDHNRNLAMAQAAFEYRLPLWNFWAAVQHLPNHGLDKNRNEEYLTRKGWDVRNLSALQVLDQVRRQLPDQQN